MSFLSTITDIATTGLFGGITGIVSSIATSIATYKMKKLDYEHERAMFDKKSAQRIKELDTQKDITYIQQEGSIETERWRAVSESQKSEQIVLFNESYFNFLPNWCKTIIAIMFASIEALRKSIRPLGAIFAYVWIAIITIDLLYDINSNLIKYTEDILILIIYIITSIISWWYCDRKIEKALDKWKL